VGDGHYNDARLFPPLLLRLVPSTRKTNSPAPADKVTRRKITVERSSDHSLAWGVLVENSFDIRGARRSP
jgi:hypothetical protein